MTEADQKTESPVDARALLKDLQGRFDVFRNFSPLAIGIDKQLIAQEPDLNRKALRLALRSHTMSTRYLKEMQTASMRLNLDASAAGEVTDEARTQPLHKVGEPYAFAADVVHNLDGSGGGTKNHGDVTNDRVTYAVAWAIAGT